MLTGMGSREQPLMLYITTAGSNVAGPCSGLFGSRHEALVKASFGAEGSRRRVRC